MNLLSGAGGWALGSSLVTPQAWGIQVGRLPPCYAQTHAMMPDRWKSSADR